MKIELHITKNNTTLKLPCGCIIDYDTNEILHECENHKEED